MKESRFIELLNLYIDQQISPKEAAELEAEIARSPAHHRTYLQYCRMHRGCAMLFENFRAPAAPLAQALRQADGKITAFPARQHRLTRIAGAAGLAVAAACVAFVLINQPAATGPSQPAGKLAVTEPTQVDVSPESFRAAATGVDAHQPKFQTVFATNRASPAGNSRAMTSAQRAAFEWMNRIELSPMPASDNAQMVFGPPAESASASPDLHFQHVRRAEQPAAEMTAFEFQP
ncbi:MAG TPA: hypothetical protein VK717_07890 [Opitutaceae bacterium]|jgi:hypothetical protein|nr:hypothetical protein [Opitutaceae bacterium]